MYSLLRPKFAIPVHGEYRHRKAQVEIAEAIGAPKENILFMSTGDVVELTEDSCRITGKVQAGGILVDGLGVGDVGSVVLRDRQNLAQNGIMIVTLGLERGSSKLLAGPEIVTRGFVYVRDSEDVMEESRSLAERTVVNALDSGITDWARIKNLVGLTAEGKCRPSGLTEVRKRHNETEIRTTEPYLGGHTGDRAAHSPLCPASLCPGARSAGGVSFRTRRLL